MGSIVVIPPDAGIDGGQRTQPLIDPRSASRSLAAHKFRGDKISSLRLLLRGSARNSSIPPWLPRGILPCSLQGVLCCVTLAFGESDTILSMPRYYVFIAAMDHRCSRTKLARSSRMSPCHCALPLRYARKIVLELVRGEEARDT